MHFKPKPHVSDALRHLRYPVLACAIILGVCVSLQALVFGFVHFTDARWDQVEEVVTGQPVTVVPSPTTPNGAQATSLTGRMVTTPKQMTTQTVMINRVLSKKDGWLRSISGIAASLGFIAVLVLVFSMHQGVVVAGGGSVPGVEKAVTASTWGLVIAILCAPIGELIAAFPIRGVFAPYASLTGVSDAVRAGLPDAPGSIAFYAEYLFLPLLVLAGLCFVVAHFFSGVEQGVIATSVNELDEKLAREMSSIKSVSSSAPRSIGALNQAIGDRSPAPSAPARSEQSSKDAARRMKAPSTGEPLHRPI